MDAETGRQKSPLKRTNAHRDKNPGIEWPEIRAETPYLASYRKRPVCGDWMVVCAVRYEPVSDPKFPAKGHFAGNFEQNTRLCPTALVSCAVITRLTSSETRVPFELFPFFPPMGASTKSPTEAHAWSIHGRMARCGALLLMWSTPAAGAMTWGSFLSISPPRIPKPGREHLDLKTD